MKFKLFEGISNLKLYHGSTDNFDKLDKSKFNTYDPGYLGPGFYLTEDFSYAKQYGTVRLYTIQLNNPIIIGNMPKNVLNYITENCITYIGNMNNHLLDNTVYYMNRIMKNPLYNKIAMDNKSNKILSDDYLDIYRGFILKSLNSSDRLFHGALMDYGKFISDGVQKFGYDGIILPLGNIKYKEVVIYEPEQVKLITNI